MFPFKHSWKTFRAFQHGLLKVCTDNETEDLQVALVLQTSLPSNRPPPTPPLESSAVESVYISGKWLDVKNT